MVIEEEHEAGLSNDDNSPERPSIMSGNSRSKEKPDSSHLHMLKA